MLLDILHTTPMSGAYREFRFGHSGICTWVRVTDDDGDQWVGVFGNGVGNWAPEAPLFPDGRHAFIGAGGQGYVVDLRTRALTFQTTVSWLQQAVPVPHANLIIACSSTTLYGFGLTGEEWSSEPVALDDIRLDRVDGPMVEGKIWQTTGWHAFTLDCDTWAYTQGPFLAAEWTRFPAPAARTP